MSARKLLVTAVALIVVAPAATSAQAGELLSDSTVCAMNGLSFSRKNAKLHAPHPSAEALLQSIVDRVGIENDFLLKAATFKDATPMAFADIKNRSVRRIVYDRDIFHPEDGLDFTFAAVLAHEVGHHLNTDLIGVNRPNHTEELRADFFGGYVVSILGGSEADALAVTRYFGKASKTHPAQGDRIEAFRAGWEHGETMKSKRQF